MREPARLDPGEESATLGPPSRKSASQRVDQEIPCPLPVCALASGCCSWALLRQAARRGVAAPLLRDKPPGETRTRLEPPWTRRQLLPLRAQPNPPRRHPALALLLAALLLAALLLAALLLAALLLATQLPAARLRAMPKLRPGQVTMLRLRRPLCVRRRRRPPLQLRRRLRRRRLGRPSLAQLRCMRAWAMCWCRSPARDRMAGTPVAFACRMMKTRA